MKAVIGQRRDHYERLRLTQGVIQPWEDGLRTGAADGTFEWWYLDCHLDDGSTLTIEFHTKPPYMSPSSSLTPFVWLTLDRPDGTQIQKTYIDTPDAFAASAQDCDVTIGANTFKGSTEGYAVHVDIDEIVVNVALTATVPPWRPETGHIFFGDEEQNYIAWLPIVTRASAKTTLVIDNHIEELTGTGYHDHNWGNIAPRKVLDHWYWGRARIGDYTIITLMFVCDEAYDKQPIPVVMVAKSGEILASAVGTDRITFSESQHSFNATTGVPVAHELHYELLDQESIFAVTFQHRKDGFMLDFGEAGAYHRFLGDVTFRHVIKGQVATFSGQTMWELLFFGARPDIAPGRSSGSDRMPLITHQA